MKRENELSFSLSIFLSHSHPFVCFSSFVGGHRNTYFNYNRIKRNFSMVSNRWPQEKPCEAFSLRLLCRYNFCASTFSPKVLNNRLDYKIWKKKEKNQFIFIDSEYALDRQCWWRQREAHKMAQRSVK